MAPIRAAGRVSQVAICGRRVVPAYRDEENGAGSERC